MESVNSREVLTYRADAIRTALPEAVDLVAETVRNPLFKEDEFARSKVSK